MDNNTKLENIPTGGDDGVEEVGTLVAMDGDVVHYGSRSDWLIFQLVKKKDFKKAANAITVVIIHRIHSLRLVRLACFCESLNCTIEELLSDSKL